MSVMTEDMELAAMPGIRIQTAVRTDAVDQPFVGAIDLEGVSFSYGDNTVLHDVTMQMGERQVSAFIGPSGCGKSTFLRTLNRMHETVPGARIRGRVLLDGTDIYQPGVDPVSLRRQVGMVFQRATAFPTMSIRGNVAAGLKVLRAAGERLDEEERVEEALRRAALWEEVRDRLDDSALDLSGGQQQRVCIARALAMDPSVLLLDEPTASLDPISTEKVEDLVHQLRNEVTVVIVTHNMEQAARVSDQTAFFLHGEMVELSPTAELFTRPRDPRTEAYITGRFG